MLLVLFYLAGLLAGVCSLGEYGEYKLYRQVGDLIYDYSNNNFHGVNGDSINSDSADGSFTDRGIELDGSVTHLKLHTDEWGAHPFLPTEWSFTTWIYIEEYGPILLRRSTSSNTVFSLKIDSSLTVRANICDGSCNLYYFIHSSIPDKRTS